MGLRDIEPKFFGITGIAASALMIVSVLICVCFQPGWDYKVNSMCDFGVSEIKAISVLFISACSISGVLFMISGLGWFLHEDKTFVRIGGLVVIISGLGLIAVGIFDKTYDFHQYVSIVYAIIFIVAIAFVCLQDIIDRHLILVAGFAVVGVYGFITLFVSSIPYALTQTILMGYVFFWFIMKSLKFFDPQNPKIRKIIGMD